MKPLYLDGNFTETKSSEPVHNPWSGEKLADVCTASATEVEAALASCHRAFAKTRLLTAAERSGTLDKIAKLLAARRQEFIDTIVAEAGKPVVFAEAEVDRARTTFRFAAALALMDEGHGIAMDASPPGTGHFGLVRRFPIGTILGITPFNFPLNLVAHKVAPCLATGNTMLLKPAMKTPLSALLLAEDLHEAGVPAGQVNVVPFGHKFVDPLLADPRVATIRSRGQPAHMKALDEIIAAWTAGFEGAELEAMLQQAEVPSARAYTIADIYGDPHFAARGMLQQVPHPVLGHTTQTGVVPRLSATPGRIRHTGPDLGADSAAIRQESGLP